MLPPLKNDRLLRAIRREPLDRTPIWIMRQAGRYLPEYREIRAKAGSFMALCKTPEFAAEVTLQPLRRFPLDAAILFSDILTIPDAMGLELHFTEGKGPGFTKKLDSEAAIRELFTPTDMTRNLSYVYDTIKIIQENLQFSLPLIGFCGSPWTVAAYMLEGEAKPGFPKIHALLKENPALLNELLAVLAHHIAAHLLAQIKAGVNVVMLFDTWGGLLGDDNYHYFSLRYIKMIIAILRDSYTDHIPIILFTKGGARWIESMAACGCDAIGVDWEISLKTARALAPTVALQGNLNPAILLEPPQVIRKETARILKEYGRGSGHIFNLGHGITPDVPPEHVSVLVDAVHQLSQQYHEIGEDMRHG